MADIETIQKMLKRSGVKITDEELSDYLIVMEDLIRLWLDSFERDIFQGKTLQELLSNTVL